MGNRLRDELPDMLRREYPRTTVTLQRDPAGMVGTIAHDDLQARIQVVAVDASHRRYSIKAQDVGLRYEDLPVNTVLDAPTATSAAAMKLNAWAERAAPRDLCDLFGLAQHGLLDDKAVALASDAGWHPSRWMFADDRIPTARTWQGALGHQMAELPDPTVAMTTVRTHVLAP